MADTTYTIDANVNPALRNLDRLNNRVQTLNGVFTKFGALIGGLAIGSFINNALRAADAVDELAMATGISIAAIDGLGKAFLANGSDADGATQAIIKFSRSVGEAAEGSAKLQDSFKQVGVDLNDLRTLSEEDLLRKTIQGLSELEPGAQRTALAMELLGKKSATVDFTGVNAGLDGFVQKSKEAEPSIQAAATLMGNLDNIAKSFGTELVKNGGGLVEMFAKLTANTDQIAKDLATITKIITAATAAFLIFNKVIPAITAGMGALQTILTAVGGGGGILVLMTKNVKQVGQGLLRIFTATGKVTEAAGTAVTIMTRLKQVFFTLAGVIATSLKVLLRFAGIVGIIYSVGQAVDFIIEKFTGFSILDWVAEKIEWVGSKLRGLAESMGLIEPAAPSAPARSGGGGGGGAGAPAVLRGQATATREVEDATKSLRDSIREVTKAYADRNVEFQQGLQDQLKSLDMSQEEIALAQAKKSIDENAQQAIDELIKKKQELTAAQRHLIPEIDREIAAIRNSTAAQKQAAAEILAAIEQRVLAQEKLNNQLELTRVKAGDDESLMRLQEQLGLVGQFGDQLENNLIKLDVERELRGKLNDLALKQIELENQRATLGEQRFQQEMAQIEALRQAAMGYANARLEAENKLVQAQRNADRIDVKGAVSKRLDEIARSVDPAVLAVQQVNSVFDNMNRSIDDFVKTGKFKFKDFARSVIQDLIAIQLKAQATKLLNAVIGNIFGGFFANGGTPPIGKVSVVGEKGPELFVPRQAGTIIPNNQLGGGAMGGPITNNYITNNISAIDSKSVAQLFAENRKTLLGTVQMAQRELPG